MYWIYLSPHLDDAALSCGGWIWEQARAGDTVSIWTVFAGWIPAGPISAFAGELHSRWRASREESGGQEAELRQTIVALRREEDIQSCAVLAASFRHFDIPDCIYRFDEKIAGQRMYYYAEHRAIFGRIDPGEIAMVEALADELASLVPAEAHLVVPLGLGNHIDHQLTRQSAERLGRDLWYYADFPYTREEAGELEQLREEGWKSMCFPVSQEGVQAWQESVAAHRSQISSFWPDLETMKEELRNYQEACGGVRLWKPPGISTGKL